MAELRKLTNKIYRVTLTADRFGQITKIGREWHAEVRHTETGALTRFAGVWSTRRDAVEELTGLHWSDL